MAKEKKILQLKCDLKENARLVRERREILEQVQNPIFCGDNPSEVL